MKTQNASYALVDVPPRRLGGISLLQSLMNTRKNTIGTRWNGEKNPGDIPKELYDDSDHKWTKGELKEDGCVYGVKRPDGNYDYEVTFTAGPRARAWFEEQDKKYLRELLSNGKLKEVEPAVCYWWQKEGGEKIEIGDWWVRKWAECSDKTGTEMAQKLQQTEQEYKQYGERMLQEAKLRTEQETKLKAQQEAEARTKKEQEARLAPLRTKLQSLIPDCNKHLQAVKSGNNFQFLSQSEQSSVQKFTTTLQQLDSSKLNEPSLNQNIKYLSDWSAYLTSLSQKVTELAAKAKTEEAAKKQAEDARKAQEARLAQLRTQLQAQITEAKKCYQLVVTGNNLQLFPEQERSALQNFITSTNQLDPSKLDEASLTKNSQTFTTWQQYLSSLPQRTEKLLQESAARAKAEAEAQAKKSQEIAVQKEKAEQYEEEEEGAEALDNYEKAATNYLRAKKIYQSLQTLDPSFASSIAKIDAKIEELKAKSKQANTPPSSYSPPASTSKSPQALSGEPVNGNSVGAAATAAAPKSRGYATRLQQNKIQRP